MNVVILRCRNCDEANKKIYIKQICDASTCRMTMIRRALDSPMSQDLPRYLERCRRPHRKFSRNTLKKKFQLKTCRFVRIFELDFELHFSKSQLFRIFLTYIQIGASYGHDFFTDAKNKVERTSQIPSTLS